MPKTFTRLAFAGVSLLSMPTSVFAQGVPAASSENAEEVTADIVVSARRREESVQDVPLVVNAVTAESVEKLNLRDFRDVQSVVPGLQLNPSLNGSQSSASLRGLNNDVTAAGFNGTVQFYLNDAPISLSTLLTSMFDIGQIEVLRGPQGTLRGRAAPSGSITVTTRRPDLQEVGGYLNLTGQTHGAINAQGAIGVPIIRDVLAVRVAGVVEENSGSRVRSINNGLEPFSRTHAERVSVRFDPIDSLSINASFFDLVRDGKEFTQVESGRIVDPTVAVSPVLITAQDRLAVGAIPTPLHTHVRVWNWQGDWRIAGQRLVYVGSHSKTEFENFGGTDVGASFLAFPAAVRFSGQPTDTSTTEISHELRLQSDERLFGMFDYVLGGFIYKTRPNTQLQIQTPIFTGIFQNPATFVPTPANFATVSTTDVIRSSSSTERSAFFNLTAHLGEATEISGGVRYIDYKSDNRTIIAAAGLNRNDPANDDQWIYTASVKHRFSRNLMVYASVGSSWRPGAASNGVIDTNAAPSPVERALQGVQPSETSTSYEIGFKSDFLDRRLRLNVSAFHQDFKNFIFFAPNVFVAYTDPGTGARNARQLSGLGVGVPAKVDGIEGELNFQASQSWSLGLSAAYAKSKIKNGAIPCNNFVGTPSYASIVAANGGQTIGTCRVNFSASRSSPFSATAQSEFTAPVSTDVNAFVRGLLTFNGKSVGDPTNPYDDYKAYALANLYAGIRSPDGAWEVSFFAKNLFDTDHVIGRNATVASVGYTQITCVSQIPACGLPAGRTATAGGNLFSTYRNVTLTPPREFGLSVRYSFGSR